MASDNYHTQGPVIVQGTLGLNSSGLGVLTG